MFSKFGILVILPLFSLGAIAQVADERGNEEVDAATSGSAESKARRMEELKAHPALYAAGASTVYSGDHLGNIDFHVGSIGGGAIRLDGQPVSAPGRYPIISPSFLCPTVSLLSAAWLKEVRPSCAHSTQWGRGPSGLSTR